MHFVHWKILEVQSQVYENLVLKAKSVLIYRSVESPYNFEVEGDERKFSTEYLCKRAAEKSFDELTSVLLLPATGYLDWTILSPATWHVLSILYRLPLML